MIKKKKKCSYLDDILEQDENYSYIVGYTSNGVPYGATMKEANEMYSAEADTDYGIEEDIDLPF